MTDPAVSACVARPRRGSDVLVGVDVGGTAMSAGLIDLDKDTTVRGGAALVAYHHPATP